VIIVLFCFLLNVESCYSEVGTEDTVRFQSIHAHSGACGTKTTAAANKKTKRVAALETVPRGMNIDEERKAQGLNWCTSPSFLGLA
jgi:hypothetical protein